MSWAEVQKLKDKMSALADATLYINVGKDYAGKTLMLKRYDSDYMSVTVGSQGTAEVSVQPKSRYELVTSDESDGRTSDVFYVEAGDYKEVNWDMSAIDGATVLPLNDIVLLQKCAGVYDKYKYSTADEAFSDSALVTTVLSTENARKYLIRSLGFATYIDKLRNYGANITDFKKAVALDPQWSAVVVPDIANYRTLLDAYAPVMPVQDGTSVSAGGHTATVPSIYSTDYLGNAFDRSPSTTFYTASIPLTLVYTFPSRCVLKRMLWNLSETGSNNYVTSPFTVEGTNDDSTWSTVATGKLVAESANADQWFDFINNTVAYNRYRVTISNETRSDGYIMAAKIDLVGVYVQ